MLDTTTILLTLAVLQLGVLLFIYKNSAEALRLARSGAGAGGGVAAVSVSKGERQEAERLAKAGTALREKVLSLPATLLGPGGDTKLRAAFLWTPIEVAALHPKTPALKELGEEAAANADAALGWLLEQAQRVRATPLGRGESYIDFPHDKWGRMHHEALDALQTLAALGGVLGQSAERR